MSHYLEGFNAGFDEVVGASIRPLYSPYIEGTSEHDLYVSGYYDGFLAGSNAVTYPN